MTYITRDFYVMLMVGLREKLVNFLSYTPGSTNTTMLSRASLKPDYVLDYMNMYE